MTSEQKAIAAAVERACEGWEGTPYMRGQRMRGVAVDCANFVCAVLDELGDYPDVPTPEHSPPSLLGIAATSEWHIADMMRRYPHGRADSIEPGDIVFVRQSGPFPTHVLIAQTPVIWWHATRDGGVSRTGAGAYNGAVDRIYRPKEKDRWKV